MSLSETKVEPLFHSRLFLMPKATLTKRLEFCASHRYHNPKWDDAKNKQVFGPCNNENTHGHNYLVEVTLQGEIDPVTGMIINLYDLKQYLWDILETFDHKNLNLDTPYFTDRIPTTENLALTLWKELEQHPQMPALDRIRLYEDHTLFADVTADLLHNSEASSPSPQVSITRHYNFSSATQSSSGHFTGHNYGVEITITGLIDPETGQVVNIDALDQIVRKGVVERFHQKNISLDPVFQDTCVSEGNLACLIWGVIVSEIPQGKLDQVTVSEGPDTQATYRGS